MDGRGLFLILAAVTVVSASAAVTFRNPVYCAIWFGQSLLGTAGLFLLAGAQFLAVATVVVYAGAILVTFLFVLMLAQPEGKAAYDRVSWEAPIAAAAGVVMVGVLSMTIGGVFSPAAAGAHCARSFRRRKRAWPPASSTPQHVARLRRRVVRPALDCGRGRRDAAVGARWWRAAVDCSTQESRMIECLMPNEVALLNNYLIVGAVLFGIGMIGFLSRRNMIVMFLSAEIMLQGVSLSLVAWSRFHNDFGGQMLVLFIIAVAACEAAIALALVVALFRRRGNLDVADWQSLREANQPPFRDEPLPPKSRRAGRAVAPLAPGRRAAGDSREETEYRPRV